MRDLSALVSPLAKSLEQFVQFKRGMGLRYRGAEGAIRDLDRFLSKRLKPRAPVITLAVVRDYVARRGTESEKTRAHRLTWIREFCRYRAAVDPRTAIPPRGFLQIRRTTFVPRVLSLAEGRALLEACGTLGPAHCSPLRGVLHGTLLALLYLTGLRLGEALGLSVEDVDLDSALLHIRRAKFGKRRLVPIAPDVNERLLTCRNAVESRLGPRPPQAPFFPGRGGTRYSQSAVRAAFREVLSNAGIQAGPPGRVPRVHDLRHSFAVLRLLLWYRQDADLGAKLPLLAVYMGHVSVTSSQRYLCVTEDYLHEITRRQEARFGHLISPRSGT